MLFQSADFVIFFFFSVLVFRFLPGKFRRNWLLLCSLFFYLGFDVRFLLVLAPVIGIGFLSGLWMEHAKKTVRPQEMLCRLCRTSCSDPCCLQIHRLPS